jgi:hypothetical protein
MFRILTTKMDGEGTQRFEEPERHRGCSWSTAQEAAETLSTHYGQGLVVDLEGRAILPV